jgi:predicted dehydrogenase
VIKAAVVGVGYLGSFHAEKYSRSAKAELCGVVDISEAQARRTAEKLGTQALKDFRELPALGVQCASIAADTLAHYEIASWLLEHGIDVLVEKPMASSTEQAEQLIELAQKNGRILQVGHLERFNPAFRAMENLLTRPRFFEARRISPFAGRGHDVDVVLDLMIHDIDIIAHLVGRPLLKVDAVGVPVLTENVDIANARLTFAGGAVANVTASRVSFKSERSLRIFQPDVYIVLDYGNKKLKMYSKSSVREAGKLPQISIAEHDVEERDALADQIDSFLECVELRKTPVVSGEDGLRALELADRIRHAFQESLSLFEQGEIPAETIQALM